MSNRGAGYTWAGIFQHLVGAHNYAGQNGLGTWSADHEISASDVLAEVPVVGGALEGLYDAFIPVAITSQVVLREYGTAAMHADAQYAGGWEMEVPAVDVAGVDIVVGFVANDARKELVVDVNASVTISFEQLVRNAIAQALRGLRAAGPQARTFARELVERKHQVLGNRSVIELIAEVFPVLSLSGNIGFIFGITAHGTTGAQVPYVRLCTMFGAELKLNIPGILEELGMQGPRADGSTGGRSWQIILPEWRYHIPQ